MSDEGRKTTTGGGLFRPLLVVLAIALAGGIWYIAGRGGSGDVSEGTTFVVRRGNLDVTVLNDGTIDALESQEIRSRVKGREGVKILSIVEEGYLVTEQDVASGKILVELDSSALEDRLQNQEISVQGSEAEFVTQQAAYEIQLSENQSAIAEDRLEAKFALMDFHKFLGQSAVDDILGRLGLDERADSINTAIDSSVLSERKIETPELPVAPEITPQRSQAGGELDNRRNAQNWGPPQDGRARERWGNRQGAGRRGERTTAEGGVDPSIPAITLDDEMIEAMAGAMQEAGMPADPQRLKQMMSRSGNNTVSPRMVSRMKEMGVDLVAIARDLGKLGADKPEPDKGSALTSIPKMQVDLEYTSKRNALDFSQYADEQRLEDGEAKQRLRQLRDEKLVAEEELRVSQKLLDGQRRLAERNFITQTDLELEEVKVQKNKIRLQSAQTAEELYIRYEFPKEAESLLSAYEEALSEMERSVKEAEARLSQDEAKLRNAEQKLGIERDQLDDLREQFARCVIRAERTGLVVYGSSTERGGRSMYGSTQEPIQEGTTVRERQLILTIPDMTKMGVNVSIHESAVKRVLVGQKARMVADSNPDVPFTAEVIRVSVLPDSQNRFMNPDVKVYKTVLKLDDVIDWIRPGMSTQVEILVDELEDVVYIPIQAVVPMGDQRVVYVAKADGRERRVVETGQYTEEFIEIRSGLDAGEVVLLLPPTLEETPAYEPTEGMIEIPPTEEAA